MRLIDADKLIDNLDNMIPATDDGDYAMGIATAIQEVGRMAYEDYIEAIPISWIKNWISEHGIFRADANAMLKDWEKENDS